MERTLSLRPKNTSVDLGLLGKRVLIGSRKRAGRVVCETLIPLIYFDEWTPMAIVRLEHGLFVDGDDVLPSMGVSLIVCDPMILIVIGEDDDPLTFGEEEE